MSDAYFAWYDDGKATPDTKLFRGAQAFEDRFGKPPTMCVVAAGTFPVAMVMGVQIEEAPHVRANYFHFK